MATPKINYAEEYPYKVIDVPNLNEQWIGKMTNGSMSQDGAEYTALANAKRSGHLQLIVKVIAVVEGYEVSNPIEWKLRRELK